MLNINDIELIDIDLTNLCNLKCPLCYKAYKQHENESNVIRSANQIIDQLSIFKNLKFLVLAGNYSEPTLYPQLFDIVDFCINNNIFVFIYTNGSTHINNDNYWKTLIEKLNNKHGRIIFTVCGSVQSIHEHYRVNSNLIDIYNNATICNKYSTDNDNLFIQFIKFEYNKNDINSTKQLFNAFKNFDIINCDCDLDRLGNKQFEDAGLCAELKQYNLFNQLLLKAKQKCIIECKSITEKQIYIDNNGNIYPCLAYKMNNIKCNLENNMLTFNLNNNICYICDKTVQKFYKMCNQPSMFLC